MEKDKKFSRWALMELRGEDYQANWIDCIKLDFREYLRGDTSYLTFVKYMLFHILEIRKIKKEYNKKW